MEILLFPATVVNVSGTGSMYPTFPKGQSENIEEQAKETVARPRMVSYPTGFTLFGRPFLKIPLQRGDIIDFENDKVRKITAELGGAPAGMIKRLIGLPGDRVELRGGRVFVNGAVLAEPYTARPWSTFGGEFLPDCKVLEIPPGKLFVMGDNRKASYDSRQELGFIDEEDVLRFIPLSKQAGSLDSHWRPAVEDFKESEKIKINRGQYLELINGHRQAAGVPALREDLKLNQSARLRGLAALKANDLSFEATVSGYPMERALREVGYENIVWTEGILTGYYEADELISLLLEFPNWRKLLLGADFQDFGLAEVEGELNGCPAQIVVQHFAGYVPPNYKQEEIQSWREALRSLESVRPGWEELRPYDRIDRSDLERLINNLLREKEIAGQILKKMENNRWLTKEEEDSVGEFENLVKESNELAARLNQQIIRQ